MTDPEEHKNMTSSEEGEQVDLIVENVAFRRVGCLANGIQLVVKFAYDGKYYGLLLKTRRLVGKNRKSTATLEKIADKSGKSVISDCSTRKNNNK